MTDTTPATATEPTITGTPELWAVHILGPDDVHACASKADAVRNALWLNLSILRVNLGSSSYAPIAWAVPEVWELSDTLHAEDLARQEIEDPRWTGGQPLAEIAAEALGPPSTAPVAHACRESRENVAKYLYRTSLRIAIKDETLGMRWDTTDPTIKDGWRAIADQVTAMVIGSPATGEETI